MLAALVVVLGAVLDVTTEAATELEAVVTWAVVVNAPVVPPVGMLALVVELL